MIFLFAPALAGVAVILIITLRDQFEFRHPVPMLDQIQSELARRRIAAKVLQIFDTRSLRANRASLRVFALIESSTPPRPIAVLKAAKPNAHQPANREEVCSNC